MLLVLLLVGLRAPLPAILVELAAAASAICSLGLRRLPAGAVSIDPLAVPLAAMSGLALGAAWALVVLDGFRREAPMGRGLLPAALAGTIATVAPVLLAPVSTAGQTLVIHGKIKGNVLSASVSKIEAGSLKIVITALSIEVKAIGSGSISFVTAGEVHLEKIRGEREVPLRTRRETDAEELLEMQQAGTRRLMRV